MARKKRMTTKLSRKSRASVRIVKKALFRAGQKSKALACHACNRKDFYTEKSLKRHVAKFHTPGQKSPRGYRTRRDEVDDIE